MAKGNPSGKRATSTVATSTSTTSGGARAYATLTDTEATQIRNDVDDRYDANVKAGIKLYISDATF